MDRRRFTPPRPIPEATMPARPDLPNGERPPVKWTIKGPGGDPRQEPLPMVAKGWRLEKRPLSWFKPWHAMNEGYAEGTAAVIASGEKPILIPQADELGNIRDGHRRIAGLKHYYRGQDKEIPVWVMQLKDEHKPQEEPARLAATKAPTGGIIVNNQFQPGGRFLPRALLTIRQALARRKARAAGGEQPVKLIAPLIAAAGEAIAVGAEGAAAAGAGAAEAGAIGARGAAAAAEGGAAAGGSSGGLTARQAIDIASNMPPPKKEKERPQQMARNSTERDLNPGITAATHVVSPVDLNPTLPRRTMTDDEVKRIEDAHGLTSRERLKRTVDKKTGQVKARVEDYAAFADAITKKRLGPKLFKILNDPSTPDDVKAAHLFHHIRGEAEPVLQQVPSGEAAKWYGESTAAWESAMHHLLSRDVPGDPNSLHRPASPEWGTWNAKTGKVEGKKPFLRLMKAPLAFTSGNAKPSINAWAAYQMVKKAVETDPHNPFAHLPEVNQDAYQDWVKKARPMLPDGANFTKVTSATPEQIKEKHPRVYADAWDWHLQHGKKLKDAGLEPGYSEINIVMDRDSGRPIAISPFRKDDHYKPFPGVSPAEVVALAKAKKLRPGTIPNPSLDGHLQPKGWGTQSKAIIASSRRLAKLVNDLGPEKAAEWLESDHPIAEVRKYHPGFSWGALPRSTHVPGSYIFGEKYGPFFQNLAGKDTHFTLDKWMARHAYRAFGTLLDAKKGEVAEGGRSEGDKRVIGEAFRKAASHLGIGVSDLQALIWDMEQSLPNLFGVRNERDDFRIGGQRILERLGFDPQAGEAVGSPKGPPLPRPARPGAQQIARRGSGGKPKP